MASMFVSLIFNMSKRYSHHRVLQKADVRFVERGAQSGMEAAVAAARPSVGRPPLSGTLPMITLFTVASNLPLSPLVALLVTAMTSPAGSQLRVRGITARFQL